MRHFNEEGIFNMIISICCPVFESGLHNDLQAGLGSWKSKDRFQVNIEVVPLKY